MSSLRRSLVALALLVACALSAFAADDNADRIPKLIDRLGSAKFDERKEATTALDAIGEPALDALRKAAACHADPEVRQRAAALVGNIEGRFQQARVFATQVSKSVRIVSEKYVVEIHPGELVTGLLRGMFAELKEKLPPALEARLKNAKEMKEKELGDLLTDARLHLGARKELEEKKDIYLALKVLVSQLDPYCRFLDREALGGIIHDGVPEAGIGVELRLDPATKMAQVVTPIKDGPAHRAGLRADDIIELITVLESGPNEPLNPPRIVPTKGLTLEEAAGHLLGRAKTRLRLQVRREGKKEPLEIDVVRGPAPVETVVGSKRLEDDACDFWLDRNGKIGYVRITQFHRSTSKDLTKAVRQLERDGAKGLVLDLRFNPGGLIGSAVETSDLFTDGEILTIRSRSRKPDTFSAEADTQRPKFPIACLVNGESASASEILAGCLQDHKRAVIVGQRTRGKGSVQNIFNIDEGQLIVTSAHFIRPGGKKISRLPLLGGADDEWGVTPERDQLLELPAKEQDELAEHLKRQTIIGGKERPAFKDRQLELAVEVLRKRIDGH